MVRTVVIRSVSVPTGNYVGQWARTNSHPLYTNEGSHPRVKVSSVLDLRPPGLEFRILCLEDSVISIISSSSEGSPGPV